VGTAKAFGSRTETDPPSQRSPSARRTRPVARRPHTDYRPETCTSGFIAAGEREHPSIQVTIDQCAHLMDGTDTQTAEPFVPHTCPKTQQSSGHEERKPPLSRGSAS